MGSFRQFENKCHQMKRNVDALIKQGEKLATEINLRRYKKSLQRLEEEGQSPGESLAQWTQQKAMIKKKVAQYEAKMNQLASSNEAAVADILSIATPEELEASCKNVGENLEKQDNSVKLVKAEFKRFINKQVTSSHKDSSGQKG